MSKLFDPGYYTENDLKGEGFKSIGRNVRIAKNCQIIGLENISIGNNVRIDGYSTLIAIGKGYINLGSFVHISSCCRISGSSGITFEDFSGVSQCVSIFSSSDDFSGNSLTNPTVPEKYKKSYTGEVILNEHVIVGTNSVILPSVTIGEGASVGALSLVNKNLNSWSIYFGIPVRKIGNRSKKILELKQQLLSELD